MSEVVSIASPKKKSSLKKKVLIVEDESDIRDLIIESLSNAEFEIVGVENVVSALRELNSLQYDLVISDIVLQADKQGGIHILEKIQGANIPVILISGNADLDSMKRAVNLGAKHFFEKPFNFQKLKEEVDRLINPVNDSEQKLQKIIEENSITNRESEIFSLVSQGLSNKEIASATGTSERTVKAHLSSIFKKCRVGSRSELLSLLIIEPNS